MNDNEFFALVWKICGALIALLIVTVSVYFVHEAYRITSHADPIAAKCALSDWNSAACFVVIGRKQ